MPTRWREPLLVALILLGLTVLTYLGWLNGTEIPAGDFLAGYVSEASAWWRDGGFFDPPNWSPYAWGGYPAILSVQNSSFYLPIGLATLFGPLTPQSTAVVSALTVAFGALGVYLLGRRSGVGIGAALIGLVGWFYVTGFTWNAQHVDIFRSFAWMPWVLLAASTRWPWRRLWAVPVAALIFWQAILGAYPGILVTAATCVLVWIIVQQVREKPAVRSYLLPLALAAVGAVLMASLRYLSAAVVRDVTSVVSPAKLHLSLSDLPSLFYGPAHTAPLEYEPMRGLFIPAVVLLLIGFVRWRSTRVAPALAIVGTAVLLGSSFFPWWRFLVTSPPFYLSRFESADFKLFGLLGLCLLGMHGAQTLLAGDRPISRLRLIWPGAVIVAGVISAIGRDPAEWLLPGALLMATAAVIAIRVLGFPDARFVPRVAAASTASLLVLGVTSGAITADGSSANAAWRADRIATETAYFGSTVAELEDRRDEVAVTAGDQRPARIASPEDMVDEDWRYPQRNVVFFDGEIAVLAFVNLRGQATFETIRASLIGSDQAAEDVRQFWSAPGMVIGVDDDGLAAQDDLPAQLDTDACVRTGECGGLRASPVGWDPDGMVAYRIDAPDETTAIFNEGYYPGWTLTACTVDTGTCSPLPAIAGEHGELRTVVPAGEHIVTARYVTPFHRLVWVLFWAGIALTLVPAAIAGIRRIRAGGRAGTGTPTSPGETPGPGA